MDRKKCFVIYGIQEKKNPNKYRREREERELVKKVIKQVQDDTQSLEQEVEETHRIGKYNEGNTRPLKVRMRSQLAVEEITARANRLAQTEEYKDIWMKRDMNLEERQKEKDLRQEAKGKNLRRTETEKKTFYWRVLDMRLRRWFTREKEEEAGEQQQQQQEVKLMERPTN